MYSDQLQCILVHIYKTGGTSIERVLRKYTKPQPKHSPAFKMKKRMGAEIWDKYYKFSIVRNPWDKILSSYCYRLQRKFTPSSVTFEKFVMDFNNQEHQRPFRQTQLSWLTDEEGNFLVDKVLRFEKLTEGWEEVQAQLQINIPLPHINKSKHRDYKHYYNKRMKKAVEERFGEDIEAFGYLY